MGDTDEVVTLDAEWSGDAVTPVVRVCPDCTDDQIIVPGFTPPRDIGEAYAIVRCCGTPDQSVARWCVTFYASTYPSARKRVSFDRRMTIAPVPTDRRKPPPIPRAATKKGENA